MGKRESANTFNWNAETEGFIKPKPLREKIQQDFKAGEILWRRNAIGKGVSAVRNDAAVIPALSPLGG
jgi:hypothetical protein